MKPVLCLAPAFLLLFFATNAFGQILWRNAAYGMSIEDVLHKIPATERVTAGERLGDGAVELVRIPNFEMVNKPFEVRFYFLNEKLSQVTLAIGMQVPYGTARVIFDNLLEQLRTQYGREALAEKQAGPLASSSADWLSGQTRINVTFLSLPNTPSILNVNYQAQPGSDASKP